MKSSLSFDKFRSPLYDPPAPLPRPELPVLITGSGPGLLRLEAVCFNTTRMTYLLDLHLAPYCI